MKTSGTSKVWKTGCIAGLLMAGAVFAGAETLLVLAAASTTDALTEVAEKFTERTGYTVRFSFASAGALARQIQSGAPSDLFLSANEKWIEALGGRVEPPVRVLKNRLVLIVPKGRPLGKIDRLAVGDLRSVPAGMYAEEALKYTGQLEAFRPKMVMASSVRAVLMFVERGEVDAGIVYATDARISDKVDVVSVFSEESHSPIRYPAAVCRASKHPEVAREFLEFLQSPGAIAVFERHGFER